MSHAVRVIGWGQYSQPKTEKNPRDVMGLMALAAQRAASCLKDPKALSQVEAVFVVRSLSTHYEDAARELAGLIQARPSFTTVSKVGGNSPQTLINQAAGMIARGEIRSALVVGAETYVPRGNGEERLDSALMKGIPDHYPGEDAVGVTQFEKRHGMEHPMQGFPLFQTALWDASGLELEDHLLQTATLWARFNEAAQDHPHAWTRGRKTPEEIMTPSGINRPIAFPYTKFMNAYVTVDQTAAILLMADEEAGRHLPAGQKPVYFMGGGYAEDRQRFMIQKSDFTASPPLKAAVDKALHRSGLTLDQMDCFDIYSCFPCAVSIALKMMELSPKDPRPLTLTGGLGFFGGPGNNYNLHAVATLAQQIAEGKRRTGLVTALGWFMHKHAAGIYSSTPPTKDISTMDLEDREDYLAGEPPVPIDPAPEGEGRIQTYTVIYRPDQTPDYGVVYGQTRNNKRFIANVFSRERLGAFTRTNHVSTPVILGRDPVTGRTVAHPG